MVIETKCRIRNPPIFYTHGYNVSHHNKQYCQENKHTHHRHTDKKTVSFGSSLSSINRVQSFLSFSFFLKSCKGAKKFEKTVKRYLFITFINHCVSVPSFLSHKSFRSCESAKKFLEIFDEQSCVRSKTERTFFNVGSRTASFFV